MQANQTPAQATSSTLYSRIKHEAKIFSNILYILGKIENDGYFKTISENYDVIIKSEMLYAVNELKKIQKKTPPTFDLKGQLINNTYIYKENLKVLSNMIIDQIWKEKVKDDSINDILMAASNANFFNPQDGIPEVNESDESVEQDQEIGGQSYSVHDTTPTSNGGVNADLPFSGDRDHPLAHHSYIHEARANHLSNMPSMPTSTDRNSRLETGDESSGVRTDGRREYHTMTSNGGNPGSANYNFSHLDSANQMQGTLSHDEEGHYANPGNMEGLGDESHKADEGGSTHPRTPTPVTNRQSTPIRTGKVWLTDRCDPRQR